MDGGKAHRGDAEIRGEPQLKDGGVVPSRVRMYKTSVRVQALLLASGRGRERGLRREDAARVADGMRGSQGCSPRVQPGGWDEGARGHRVPRAPEVLIWKL